jgi:hypothetical protein
MNINLLVDANLRTFQNNFLKNLFRAPNWMALLYSLENRENLGGFQGVYEADCATIKFLEDNFNELNHNFIFIEAILFSLLKLKK